MMRWIGRMDAQRALVEGGKDDAGTGELVFLLIIIIITIHIILIAILIILITILIIIITILMVIIIKIFKAILMFLSPHPLLVEGTRWSIYIQH